MAPTITFQIEPISSEEDLSSQLRDRLNSLHKDEMNNGDGAKKKRTEKK